MIHKTTFVHMALAMPFLFLHSLRAEPSEARARVGFKEPHPAMSSPLLTEPPRLTAEERETLERRLQDKPWRILVPSDPAVRPEDITPTGPSVRLPTDDLPGGQQVPLGVDDFRVFRNTALNDAATNNSTLVIDEPSLAANGRAIFYTGNVYAAVSPDAGQTFQFINPSDNFPAVNGGFCCDQITYYDRTRGALFWLLQYWADANTNTQRLAVANSQANIVNNNFYWWDWSPSDFGFPATGYWMDFPDLAVSANFLYLTSNVFRIGSGSTSTAVIARFPLNELSQGIGFGYSWYTSSDRPSLRCTHGATSVMYFATHNSNTSMRIHRWPESSGTISWDDVGHSAYPNTGTAAAPGPDGRDWAGRNDSRILGGYLAGGVLGFMWGAPQGGGFPFPQSWLLRFRESDRALLSEEQFWSSGFAMLYPSVHPNDRGEIAGTIAFGGGSSYPNTAAWISDDGLRPGTIFPFTDGNSGPSANIWGDYLSTRRHVQYGNTWVGSGFALNGGPNNANAVPRFLWFGRQGDAPPSSNVIYIDWRNAGTWEDGSSAHPYDTVVEGHFAAVAGDSIIIRGGNYDETVTLSTPVTITAPPGQIAIIGQ